MSQNNIIKDAHCFLHTDREAVAICLSCNQYFCRECVTEHKGKVFCQACLTKLKKKTPKRSRFPLFIRALIAIFLGLILSYFLFYSLGHTLSKIPDTFHQGTYLEIK